MIDAASGPRQIDGAGPGGRSLEFKHASGETRFAVDEVPIHSVVVVE